MRRLEPPVYVQPPIPRHAWHIHSTTRLYLGVASIARRRKSLDSH